MRRALSLVVLAALVLGAGLLLRPRRGPQTPPTAGSANPAVTPAEAASGTRANVARKRFTMIACGDVMTDRNVGKAILANGADSILAKVRDFTRCGDLSFCNLEAPLSTAGPHDPSNCCFRARPETVKVLLDGGFDIVSLANNHTLNAGREGILQTFDTLEKSNILYCGAWRDKTKAGQPTYIEAGEGPVRFGFIAMTDLSFGHGSYNKVSADRANLVAQIQATRPHCDIVVVSFHWGDEYMPLPNQRQRNTAHAAINAGADLVLGHHPHTLEGLEVYKGKPILYSMGNFVFDQKEGERMESAIFQIDYTSGWGWQIMAKPVWIPRSRLGPIYPETARRDRILARLAKISKPLGTTLQLKDGKAWLRIAAQ